MVHHRLRSTARQQQRSWTCAQTKRGSGIQQCHRRLHTQRHAYASFKTCMELLCFKSSTTGRRWAPTHPPLGQCESAPLPVACPVAHLCLLCTWQRAPGPVSLPCPGQPAAAGTESVQAPGDHGGVGGQDQVLCQLLISAPLEACAQGGQLSFIRLSLPQALSQGHASGTAHQRLLAAATQLPRSPAGPGCNSACHEPAECMLACACWDAAAGSVARPVRCPMLELCDQACWCAAGGMQHVHLTSQRESGGWWIPDEMAGGMSAQQCLVLVHVRLPVAAVRWYGQCSALRLSRHLTVRCIPYQTCIHGRIQVGGWQPGMVVALMAVATTADCSCVLVRPVRVGLSLCHACQQWCRRHVAACDYTIV